jgi:tetratricopeptide (TPR) repeat protein
VVVSGWNPPLLLGHNRRSVDADIDALLARGDYLGAAALAAAAGDLARAIRLHERVWRFAEAVPLAVQLGDRPLAVRLALDARDRGLATELAAAIPAAERETLVRTAALFAGRGHHAEAALLEARAERWAEAAQLYRKAGALLDAAAMLERAGQWQEAGRLYEQAAGGDPASPDTASASLGLGRLLAGLGRPLEAARALQAAARHPVTRPAALRRLCVALLALGLPHAAQEIARRLHQEDPSMPPDAAAIAAADGGARAAGPAPGPASVPRRFRVLHVLGAGALGRVYAAEDELLGRIVALKVLSVGAGAGGPERAAFLRFLREAEAIGRLRHPHIVTLHELDEGAALMVLEHLPGGTLGDALARSGPLGPARARRLALDVLAGLGAAHRSGIVHRDVKPANVFFDAAGNAKLGDFGAAHLIDFGHTQTGSFIGTLAYLSPEQITGVDIGFPADLYGLGATLYEALTGRPPFLGPDIVGQHLSEIPAPPRALRAGLAAAHDEVLLRALTKAPGDRFASAEEMAEAIASWPAEEPVAAPAAPETAAPGEVIEQEAMISRPLGRTARGTLALVSDPRVGRDVLVETLDAPLEGEALDRLRALAAAGGPHVQRILAVGADGGSVTYEWLDGEETTAGALAAEERARLDGMLAALGMGAEARVLRTTDGALIVAVAPTPSPSST